MTTSPSELPTATLDPGDPIHGNSAPGLFWTTANIGEAAPAVMTPLDWSLWGPGNDLAVFSAWHRFGMVDVTRVRVDPDQSNRLTGIFYGRQAMNLDVIREWVDRFPGITADEFELGLAGAVRPDARPFTPLTDAQQALVAEAVERVRRDHEQRHVEMVEQQRKWWVEEVLRRADVGEPVQRLAEAFDRWVWAISTHNETRLLALAATVTVYRLAGAVDAMELVSAVTSAFGDVDELSMASDLWDLAHDDLDLDSFLERHGFHGESEGNPAGRSWREHPGMLSATLAGLRQRGADDHPQRRAERALAQQRSAQAELEARLDDPKRAELAEALRGIAHSVRETERGKGAFLRGIDGFRAAARDLGAQLVEEGRLNDADDVFLFTLDELQADRGASVGEDVLERRRARLNEYRGYVLPTTFEGMPVPIVKSAERAAAGGVIAGVGASAGRYEGTVRVITRAEDEDDLEPGDILVCEVTDPSWTPLFMLVDAVVIDVGAPGSHGAIIARELGLPAVVNTIDGSRRLRSGDRVVVDGSAGTVTVVAVGDG
jgi:phosphoenolpyruvate synthase/pyruvate phosphate dikinase